MAAIVVFTVAVLVYRFMMPKTIRDAKYLFPKPENYSLTVKPLPNGITASEFQTRFLNTDNIIQTAVLKNCSPLFRESEILFKIDREIKQMEINLMKIPHPARQKTGLFNRP